MQAKASRGEWIVYTSHIVEILYVPDFYEVIKKGYKRILTVCAYFNSRNPIKQKLMFSMKLEK